MNENGKNIAPANARAEALEKSVKDAADIVDRSYLEELDKLKPVPPNAEIRDITLSGCGSLYHLTRLVRSKDENFLDKLTTIANVAYGLGGTLTTVIRSDGSSIDYYMGILIKNHRQDTERDRQLRRAAKAAFKGAVDGNFAGSKLVGLEAGELEAITARIFPNTIQTIASISGIVALRDGDDKAPDSYVQGIENLTDALKGKKYTVLMIADVVDPAVLRQMRQGYELISTQIHTFLNPVTTVNESESVTLSDTQTVGISQSISHGISLSQSKSQSRSANTGVHLGIGVPGVNFGASYGRGNTDGSSTGSNRSVNEINQAIKQKMEGAAKSAGTGRSLQLTGENRTVKGLLEKIDAHIQRLEQCESFGAFDCAAYVLADSLDDALTVSGNYNALMRGEASYVQASRVNIWERERYEKRTVAKPADDLFSAGLQYIFGDGESSRGDRDNRGRSSGAEDGSGYGIVLDYLRHFSHPMFKLNDTLTVNPALPISGQELAIQFGLPKRSIRGLDVLEMPSFGRNVKESSDPVPLGELLHMGVSEKIPVCLDANSLTMHTFVTGSTGSGKSNTVYALLESLRKQNVPFMVVEPAKGEYKNVFGQFNEVTVYGTNPKKYTHMLKLNPFRFPSDIHILEHLDRLVEIFNVCWPMYAAMPAVLKEAMERAYTAVGWDLAASENPAGERYPNFEDLLEQIDAVIEESKYSADTKGDYIGALSTRIRSLTNGLNSLIFCRQDLSDEELFDKSAIVDLSRIGSAETKALIMGLLVMRLNEYRSTSGRTNSALTHVTVLEEAHHLLKRVSTEQSEEGANVMGKAVELLTDSIAEMRTYGEAFMIVDQSPGLLDVSAIRNTNTKIILRLPDRSDRELVGFAAGLDPDQVGELARLERGVAAVYQNDWLEPVLVKIKKCAIPETPYTGGSSRLPSGGQEAKKQLVFLLTQGRVDERLEFDIDLIEKGLDQLNLSSRNVMLVEDQLARYKSTGRPVPWTADNSDDCSRLLTDILGVRNQVGHAVLSARSSEERTSYLKRISEAALPDAPDSVHMAVMESLMRDMSEGKDKPELRKQIYHQWIDHMLKWGAIS